jgi:predicted nucleic acid-binding protein
MHLAISSLMELYYGAYKSSHRAKNLARVRTLAREFTLVGLDEGQAETFGQIKADIERQGLPLDDMDIMIAAAALSHNLVLVTNNIRHFSRIKGLSLQNWCI